MVCQIREQEEEKSCRIASSPEGARCGQERGAVVEGSLGLLHALLQLLEGGRVEAIGSPFCRTLGQSFLALDLTEGRFKVQSRLIGARTLIHCH